MNDQRFFDLAVKVIARQAKDAERADLDALLAREPELRAEFTRLEADARVAKDALPLVSAMREIKGELPVYARGRLRTMVRQTLGRPESAPEEPDRRLAWGSRWVLGLAAATAGVVIVAFFIFHAPKQREVLVTSAPDTEWRLAQPTKWSPAPATKRPEFVASTVRGGMLPGAKHREAVQGPASKQPPSTPNAPVIELGMLYRVGGTRGTDLNELATLGGTWKESPVHHFSSASELEAWEKNWPKDDGRPAAKIIYDPAAGEIRVSGRSRGKSFQRTFPLERDDLALTLQQVREFVDRVIPPRM